MQRRATGWEGTSSSTWGLDEFLRGFVFHRDIDKGESGAAECLIFAEDEGQIAADLSVGNRNGRQGSGLHVFVDVGARDETDPDVSGDETFEQFAGIEFHCD